MAKFQVPTVGGIRKVIKPGATVSNATTIAGLEGTTLTLAQLSQLLATLDKNTGGGNIGTGAEAAISVGPGLAGGGPLVGVVNIRLTAPLGALGIVEDGADGNDGPPGPPGKAGAAGATGGIGPAGPALFFLADDGADGDLGPPGPPGPLGASGATGTTGSTGAQGPIGPGLFFLADDGQDGDQGAPGVQGATGATGTTGSIGPSGAVGPGLFFLADDGQDGDLGAPGVIGPIGPRGPQGVGMMPEDANYDDQGMMAPYLTNGPNLINGPLIVNGPKTGAITLIVPDNGAPLVLNVANPVSGYYIAFNENGTLVAGVGVGPILFAGATLRDLNLYSTGTVRIGGTGSGVVSISSSGPVLVNGPLSISSATPVVVAGQTALGTTTTATVITTAGGIALPALASTFWVANVNGVKYGIPCFAL